MLPGDIAGKGRGIEGAEIERHAGIADVAQQFPWKLVTFRGGFVDTQQDAAQGAVAARLRPRDFQLVGGEEPLEEALPAVARRRLVHERTGSGVEETPRNSCPPLKVISTG